MLSQPANLQAPSQLQVQEVVFIQRRCTCSAGLDVQALDGDMSHEEVEELFHSAGEKSNGHVSVGSLANSLQQYQLLGGLFKIIKRYTACCLLGLH